MKITGGLLATMMFALALFGTHAGEIRAQGIYADRLPVDIKSIIDSRNGMQSVITFMEENPERVAAAPDSGNGVLLPGHGQRVTARQTWERFLDHVLLLDSLGGMYSELYKKADNKEAKHTAFTLSFAAFLAEYRYAMDFIELAEKHPELHIILNEPMTELGIKKESYSLLKSRFLNVARGAEFARLNMLYTYYGISDNHPLKSPMEEDIAAIWQAGRGKGPKMTIQNAGKIVADMGFTAWFPVQEKVSRMMGHTKVWRPGTTLINARQIKELAGHLKPGDILLERREWYATNVGIPGFWPHTAMYIGTAEERSAYFNDQEVQDWLREKQGVSNLEAALQKLYPEAYARSIKNTGHTPRVLEAIEHGVSFTTLEHSAAADSLVVLRPRLPKTSKARAILRGFHYAGRPYDFNFDFRTDSSLVCSELIYKAYEKAEGTPGLELPLHEVMGRPLLTPNDIARLFTEEYQSTKDHQLDFVWFLDGNENKQQANKSDLATFLTSWQRPKWHIWVQDLETSEDK